jgi:MinD-like ATPase involved in chromosome partitioning or flagellar assembly
MSIEYADTWVDRAPARLHRQPTAGALVAVCALCGGAGASTVAYLLARWAARSAPTPGAGDAVLALDAGCGTAGLSLYAGVRSPRSLAGVAEAVELGALSGQPFVTAADGLRVLGTEPRADASGGEAALTRVIADARSAHRLTVADCGTVASSAQRLVVAAASHVIWVLPASQAGLERGGGVLSSQGALPATEVVVARRDGLERKPPTRTLAALASARDAALVLMPSVPSMSARHQEGALDECSVALMSLVSSLHL